MKKIGLTLTIMLFTASLAFGAALSEGFEGTFPPTDWTNTTITGHAWEQSSAYAHGGTYSAKYKGTSGGGTGELITPRLDLTASGSDELTFWIKNADWVGDQNVCKVYISTDGGSTYSLLATYDTDITAFEQKTLDLETGITQTDDTYIKFWGEDNYGYGVYIDDLTGPEVYVPAIATSPTPSNGATGVDPLTTTTLSWTSGTPMVEERLYFGTDPTVTNNTLYPSVSSPWTIPTLDYSQPYYWRVDTDDGSKAWVNGDDWSFTTTEPPLSGIYNIGATGYDYATITDAITDLNACGVGGACTFYLRDAAYAESPMTINAITGASATNTITFKPYAGITPTITITATSGDAGFELVGADYITFDGSNGSKGRDMTIVMAGANSRAFLLSGGDGATNNTIKNCVIEGYSNTSSTNYGIRVFGTDHDNNTFENNEISKNYYGIYLYGNSSADNTGNVVKDNVIGSGTAANYVTKYGIYAKYQTNLEISGNEVFNMIYSSVPYGLYIYYSDNVTISKNNIHDIVYTGTGGYGGNGIYLKLDVVELGSNITIKNNFIRHIAGDSDVPSFVPTGIRVLGSSSTYGVKIYYNSIYLTPDTDYGLNYENNTWAAAVIIDDGPTQIDMRDNILRTSLGEKTGCAHTTYGYAVVCKGSTSPFSTIDYNIYYADNQDNNYVGLVGTSPATGSKDLAGWQTYTSQDANSKNFEPDYTSTTDLHLNVSSVNMDYAGTPIAGITTDIDGETRNTTYPYIGADEVPAYTLPVELIAGSLTAEYAVNEYGSEYVIINWATASETDVNGFNIWRNTENNFSTAIQVNPDLIMGHGTTSEPHQYTYKDESIMEEELHVGDIYYYWLQVVDLGGTSSYSDAFEFVVPDDYEPSVPPELPLKIGLYQNCPNPFNPTLEKTKICFYLEEGTNANVEIKVYNIKGELVKTIWNQYTEFEKHPVPAVWDGYDENGTPQTSGIYFYRMRVNGKDKEIRKLILIK